MNDRIAIIDTETLGLDPRIHPVWELAVITGGEEFHWFVRVDDVDREFADPVALDLNGFADRYDPNVAVVDYKLAPSLCELLAGKVIVGANPHFDLTRLTPWFDRIGRDVPWHYRPCCVQVATYGFLAARGIFAPVPWSSVELYSMLAEVGVTVPENPAPHTALGDARHVRDIWQLVNNG